LIKDNNVTYQGAHMTTKRVKKTYTKAFKEEAVSLVVDQGYSVTEAANSLGVTTKVIYNWKQKIEAQKSGELLSDDERTELIKLRKENKRLLIEREILKKASAFFAKEMK
tara:strand:- start:317 stop:646 length:330 start_codon:yes stop_codon:yes gene_type:complete